MRDEKRLLRCADTKLRRLLGIINCIRILFIQRGEIVRLRSSSCSGTLGNSINYLKLRVCLSRSSLNLLSLERKNSFDWVVVKKYSISIITAIQWHVIDAVYILYMLR